MKDTTIGIDLGGTTVSSGRIENGTITKSFSKNIDAEKTEDEVMGEVYLAIDHLYNNEVKGIGVGVPGLVDARQGIVYSLANIPSWQQVHLKQKLEKRYGVPAYVNNDANCFAAGVKYFGQGKPYENLVGITLGTGLGTGLILNNRLYSGKNCGAGEYGMLPHKDHNIEYYCSGQYFEKECGISGKRLYERALAGNVEAIENFKDFGGELGQAIKIILYTLDPEVVILGGSVSQAFEFFKGSLMREIETFEFKHVLKQFMVIQNQTPHIAILGAAALYEDSIQTVHE